MPATWDMYGVDANGDGVKDPFNPVDAIFAAARYLKAAGADSDIRRAVFAYNHADWYVDSVLMRAQVIGGLPGDLVGSLTGLTQGRFPVHAKATYAGQLTKKGNKVKTGNAAMVVESDGARSGIEIFSKARAPIIAVNDGRVVKIGHNKRLGKFVMLQDVYGNTYTYAHLGDVAETYPAPKDRSRAQRHGRKAPARDAEPEGPASKTRMPARKVAKQIVGPGRAAAAPLPAKERLFAHPERPAARAAGGDAPAGDTDEAEEATQDAPLGFDAARLPSRAAQEGRPPDRRHDHRPPRRAHARGRRRTCSSRSAPPAPARRGSTRSRSSTAGSCSSRPRSTAPRARTRSSARTPRTRRSARCSCSARSSWSAGCCNDARIQIYGCGDRRRPLRPDRPPRAGRRCSTSPARASSPPSRRSSAATAT